MVLGISIKKTVFYFLSVESGFFVKHLPKRLTESGTFKGIENNITLYKTPILLKAIFDTLVYLGCRIGLNMGLRVFIE